MAAEGEDIGIVMTHAPSKPYDLRSTASFRALGARPGKFFHRALATLLKGSGDFVKGRDWGYQSHLGYRVS